MRENNTAVTKTPMTEYIVDGDKIYPKQTQPSPDNTSTITDPKDGSKKRVNQSPTRTDNGLRLSNDSLRCDLIVCIKHCKLRTMAAARALQNESRPPSQTPP